MIASGLPHKNGDKHALQIALASLHIVHVVSYYNFPNVAEEGLQIRVGIHTGKFGENVNLSNSHVGTSKALGNDHI